MSMPTVWSRQHVAFRRRSVSLSQFFGQGMPNRTERQSSLGSGVIIESRGIVVTIQSCHQGRCDIRVGLADGREFGKPDPASRM